MRRPEGVNPPLADIRGLGTRNSVPIPARAVSVIVVIMTGSFSHLLLASFVFVFGHVLLSARPLRDPLVDRLGEGPFLGVYSAVIGLAFAWMIWAYGGAPEQEVWEAHTAVKHLSLSLMILVCVFVVASLTPKSPTMATGKPPQLADGPVGIFRITRHPMMWGFGVWALLHLAANGDAASIIFFGSLAVLALGGSVLIDRRKARQLGDAWQAYAAETSHLPFAAIIAKRGKLVWSEIGWLPVLGGIGLYLVVLVLHETLFGIAPMSWVSGLFD